MVLAAELMSAEIRDTGAPGGEPMVRAGWSIRPWIIMHFVLLTSFASLHPSTQASPAVATTAPASAAAAPVKIQITLRGVMRREGDGATLTGRWGMNPDDFETSAREEKTSWFEYVSDSAACTGEWRGDFASSHLAPVPDSRTPSTLPGSPPSGKYHGKIEVKLPSGSQRVDENGLSLTFAGQDNGMCDFATAQTRARIRARIRTRNRTLTQSLAHWLSHTHVDHPTHTHTVTRAVVLPR